MVRFLACLLFLCGAVTAEEGIRLSFRPALSEEATAKGRIDVYVHPIARHFLLDVGGAGDWLQLEDGSKWLVIPQARYETRQWWPSDVVYITQTYGYGSYGYIILNETRGAYVVVGMLQKSSTYSGYTKCFQGIDYFSNSLWLCDGSFWHPGSRLSNWYVGDTVLIGLNSNLDNALYPFLLINTSSPLCDWVSCELCQ